ncbi:uncharacterized protein JCM6883_005395 [Sporobolomyces salmoneus]|uniref:uncharacterized protein n=1 Tax=Sporobolomyces salmoneus TaxID=183962 RepID=UPI00317900E1
MDSDSDQPEKKKRRVTKACDQCRRRRIKCASYGDGALDAPCVICTDAGQAASCTYTRPTRKRGPQAGKSKSLQEKCDAFERLLGHLLIAVPSITTHIDVFFRHSTANPPPSASPSSASSSNALPTTSDQQIQAYQGSRIAQQVETVAAPSSAPSSTTTTKRTKKESANSPAPSSNASLPTASPNFGYANLSAQPHPSPGFVLPNSFSTPHMAQGGRMLYPFAPTSTNFELPTDALQALARAAVPDQEQAMEGVVPASPFLPQGGGGQGAAARPNRLDIPLLPSESIRNQLLDLYFNQVVQPYFPMLDKTLFLRWSAHLPAVPTRTATSLPSSRLIAPTLYLAVFALASSYLPPSAAVSTHPPRVWAEAARAHLWADIERSPNLETVQAAIIGVLVDWGAGELNRAWIISSIAVSLAINLSLHLAASSQPDPNSLKLKTFHSALILHTLLSLRLSRAPLVVLEDYNVPIPPIDGNEDFELWRSDKTPVELREDWKHSIDPMAPTIDSPSTTTSQLSPVRAPQAVRSASLSTFAKMASLCAIGLAILRWDVSPRRGYGQSLAAGERERVELIESLKGWADGLENELKLGGDKGGGVERLEERARWCVEMHLVLAALNLKLRPDASFAATAFDPVPSALILLHHILIRYQALFTMYRSLPSIDFSLHTLSATLFEQNDYAPHQHDAPLKAYDEMSRLFPVAKSSLDGLRAKVDGHKRELGLLRGIHPMSSSVPPPSSSTTATAPLSEPFQAFLSYSADLGPAANPQTVLDFGSWDQTDLLFSLGLVGNPNDPINGWGLPPSEEDRDGSSVPPLIEANFPAFESGLPYPPGGGGGGSAGGETNSSNMNLDQSLINLASTSFKHAEAPRDRPFSSQTDTAHQHFDPSIFGHLSTQFQPHTSHSTSSSSLHHPPPSYPSAQFFTGPSSVEAGLDTSGDAGIATSEERSTDLLTRWLSRGSMSLGGFEQGDNRALNAGEVEGGIIDGGNG